MKMLLLFLVATSAFAQDKRDSSVSANVQFASNKFRNTQLSGNIGIDAVWAAYVQAQRAVEADQVTNRSFRAGGDIRINEEFDMHAGLQGSREPSELKSWGLHAGMGFLLSSLWKGSVDTRLSWEAEGNRYYQESISDAGLRSGDFQQGALHLGIWQEISETVSASLNVSAYRYHDGGNYRGVLNRRRLQPLNNQGLIEGFPERAADLLLAWRCSDSTSLAFGAGSVRPVETSDRTRTLSFDITQSFGDHWSILAGYSRSKPKNNTASDMGELGVSYLF